MRKTTGFLACAMLLLLSLGSIACQKIDSGPTAEGGAGPLAVELSPDGDGIPESYGELVGITPDPVNQWQAVLWFEAPDRTVRAVWVNTGRRRVVAALAIPRR